MTRFILHFVYFGIFMTVDIPMWVWYFVFGLQAAWLFSMINVKKDDEFKNLD